MPDRLQEVPDWDERLEPLVSYEEFSKTQSIFSSDEMKWVKCEFYKMP